ncbi:MAG: PBS lyase [Leptolyngbya sp. DLM2.Bin15]|nr:MAG: PBS lyase [Leptolyngbya sp. DLM2.Bin15]
MESSSAERERSRYYGKHPTFRIIVKVCLLSVLMVQGNQSNASGSIPEPLRALHNHLQQREGVSQADPADAVAVMQWALRTLDTADFGERWDIAKLLSPCGAVAIAPILDRLQRLDDDDWELQWYLIRVLGDCRHPNAMTALAHQLQTTDHPDIAQAAAIALANMGPPAIPVLAQLLEVPEIRLRVVQALAQLSDAAVIPVLQAVVNDPTPAVRAAALEALAQHRDDGSVTALVQGLADHHAEVRRTAASGLGRFAPMVASADLVNTLEVLLTDVNLDVAGQAAITLGRLGTEDAVVALTQPLRSPHTPAPLLTHVIHALGWIATPTALQQLAEFLHMAWQEPHRHRTDTVCGEAIAMVSQITDTSLTSTAATLLIQVLQEGGDRLSPILRQRLALGLGRLQEAIALDPLVQLLTDTHAGVQLHAIAALKLLPGPTAYDHLQDLAQQADLDPDLAQGVAIALREWHR